MKRDLLEEMRNGVKLTTHDQIKLIFSLSLPAILAQISFVFMEYIDAAMVGQLGANPSASIGLVAPLTWVFFGIMSASVTGFSVQVAQWIGANDGKKARNTFKLGAIVTLTLSFIFCAIGLGIALHVPVWLDGEEAIRGDDARRAIDRGKAFRPHEAAFVDVYRLWHCDDGRHGRFDVRRSPHHVCHTYARRRDSNLGHSSLAHRSLCRAALRRRARLHGFPTRRWRYTRPEFAQFGEYVGRSHYAIVFARRFDGARRHLDGDGH